MLSIICDQGEPGDSGPIGIQGEKGLPGPRGPNGLKVNTSSSHHVG